MSKKATASQAAPNHGKQVSEFLSAFFPDENEPIHFRFFKPRGVPDNPNNNAGKLSASRAEIANDLSLPTELVELNQTRGVYFVVNSGGDHDAAITGGECQKYKEKKCPDRFHEPGRFNAWFAESDTATMKEQHAALDGAPLQPLIRVETKKSVHAYWLITGPCTVDEWREVQARLISFFGGDEKIKNPSRVMRVPGFDHLSADGSRKRVECVVFKPERRYSVSEMLNAFPASAKGKGKLAQASGGHQRTTLGEYTTWDALRAELGRRVMSHESAKQNCSGKWDCRALCHDGKGDTGLFYDPANNQAYCNAGCEQAAILRAFGLPVEPDARSERPSRSALSTGAQPESAQPPKDDDAKKGRKSQADELTQLTQSVELFYCPEEDTSFASFTVKNHRETHKLNSKAFRHYLAHLYYQQTGKVPNAEALQSTLSCLEGKARYDGDQWPTFLRLAAHDACIYWDLCNADWEIVEISATGWRVIPAAQAPVRFRRTRGMQALPTPVSGGDLNELRRFVNYPNDRAWVLHVAWLVAALRADGRNFPVLIFNSEQGSAKSTASRMTRSLIDPNVADLRPKPREDLDLFLAARNGWVCGFDNLSGLQRDFSDSLCRLATGTGFGKRELYSDEEEVLFQVARPVLLNGIDDLAEKADLVDRSIFIELPPIPDEDRQDEKTLWQEFDAAKPALLGALADAASKALRNLPAVKLDRLPRMADFAKWGAAAEVGGAGMFLTTYYDNRETANESAIQANEFAGHVFDWFDKQGDCTITLADLLEQLEQEYKESLASQRSCATSKVKLPKYWPANAKKLSNELRRIAPILRKQGLEIEDAGLDSTTRKAKRHFCRVTSQNGRVFAPSQASHPSDTLLNDNGTSSYSAKDRPKDANGADFLSFGSAAPRRMQNGASAYPSGHPSAANASPSNDLAAGPKGTKDTKDEKPSRSGSAQRKVVRI